MKTSLSNCLLALVAICCWTGCVQQASDKKVEQKEAHDHDHEHAHETGPHGGDLIELGDEEYHAELAHDEDSGDVTIYILDSEAKKNVAVAMPELVVKVKAEGSDTSFTLPAVPDEGEADGMSSRFKITSKELIGLLEREAEISLTVTVGEKEVSGKFKHEAHHHH